MQSRDRVAVITGASRGIGAAIATRFSQDGLAVVLNANEPSVHDVVDRIRAAGGRAIAVEGDVTNAESVSALYDEAERAFGRVDISVQNAGVITIARIEEMTESEWDKVLAVNTKGVFLCCREAIARIRKHGQGGRLINTASGQARQASYSRHIMLRASSEYWVLPRALPGKWPRSVLPSMHSVPVSSALICGLTMTRTGASCLAIINPAS